MKVSKRVVRHVATKQNGNSGHSVVRVRRLLEDLIGEVNRLEAESLPLCAVTPLDCGESIDFYQEVQNLETALIQKALSRTNGSQIEAARLLGLLPSTLNMKIRRYHLQPPGQTDGGIRRFPTVVRSIGVKSTRQKMNT